jgi:predicted nucleic acid-binding Zn ribbon protein
MSTYKCELCGKEFERRSNAIYCGGPHYRPCPVCGKPVPFKNPGEPIKCCSKECRRTKQAANRKLAYKSRQIVKTCSYCGKKFTTKGYMPQREHFCSGPHYTTCEVCGDVILIKDIHSIPKTCSAKCKGILGKRNTDKTMLEKYGVTHFTQVPEFRAKAKATRALHKEETLAKFRATCKERYDAEHPMQNPTVHQKASDTNLIRYGAVNPAYNDDIKKKISERVSAPETQAKRIQTSLAHYGTEYPAQSPIVMDKMKSTCTEKYGYPFSTQNPAIKQKVSASVQRFFAEHPEVVQKIHDKAHETMQSRHGVDYPCQLPQCRANAFKVISDQNQRFAELLRHACIDVDFEMNIGAYSYDLFIPKQHICIEINPTYTHNSVGNHFGIVRDRLYHFNKWKAAQSQNIQCIHVFDWDNKDKIVSMLVLKADILLNDCTIMEISESDANDFLVKHHVHGAAENQIVCLGLFHDDSLIQIMTFGKPQRKFDLDTECDWEIIRVCIDEKYAVTEGAEKLWSYFVAKYQPKHTVAYCDISKFTGDVYYSIGMQLDSLTEPNKLWSKGMQMIPDDVLNQRGYAQLLAVENDDSVSNEDYMLQNGWLPVYDCGYYRFII